MQKQQKEWGWDLIVQTQGGCNLMKK